MLAARAAPDEVAAAVARRGRRPGTTHRELEIIALRLFAENGFEDTTVDEIAAEAGVSRRTFFRYFDSKSSVLWGDFDAEVSTIETELARTPDRVAMMPAIRAAVLAANDLRQAHSVPELRIRLGLISTLPALLASAAVHYDAWERAISRFAARRLGQEPDSLLALAVGRATLAVCRAAYDRWLDNPDVELVDLLDVALSALENGFSQPANGGQPAKIADKAGATPR